MGLPVPSLQSLASGLPGEVAQKLRSALSAQDEFNRRIQAILSPAQTWQTPQLLNGWQNFSSHYVARYTQLPSGVVVLSGAIKSGTIGTVAFVLPALLRPDQDVAIAVDSNGALGRLVVHPSGNVSAEVGSNSFFSLESSFLVL